MAKPEASVIQAGDSRQVYPRAGSLTVAAPHVTGSELETVRNALEHPPSKPDWISLVLSIASTALLWCKTLSGHADGKILLSLSDFIVLAASLAVVAVAMYRCLASRSEKHPFHEQAKAYVEMLQKHEKESQVSPAPAMIIGSTRGQP